MRDFLGGEEGILPRSDSGTGALRTKTSPARFFSRPSNPFLSARHIKNTLSGVFGVRCFLIDVRTFFEQNPE
jgi:hypothetical protein